MDKRRKRSPEEIEAIRRRRMREERARRQGSSPNNRRMENERVSRPNSPSRKRSDNNGTVQRRRVESEVVNRESIKRRSRKNSKKRVSPLKKVAIGIGMVLCIIILLLSATIIGFFSKIENNCSVDGIKPSMGECTNILVLGLDIGAVGQEEDGSIKRTDTMLLVSYNPSSKTTNVISIPRDTLIQENGSSYKVNAAYPMGGDSKVISVVENLLSTQINYLVKVDYEAFRSVIDAIGGVDMEIEQDMIYDDEGQNLHINFKGGTTVHLDGQKAEEYFRWRKNNDGTGLATGDLGRIENQQKLISKVVDKIKSPATIFKVSKILDSIAVNIDTNMSGGSMFSTALKVMTSDLNITTLKGEGKMIGRVSYFVLYKDENADLIEAINGGNVEFDSFDKSSLKILVENGTNRNKLAARGKILLEGAGWNSIDVGNGDLTKKSIIYCKDKEVFKLIEDTLGNMKTSTDVPEKDRYADYDIIIILGDDYNK